MKCKSLAVFCLILCMVIPVIADSGGKPDLSVLNLGEYYLVRPYFGKNADQIRFILSYAEGRLRGSGGATRPRQQREEW